jgi:hypothetical protein
VLARQALSVLAAVAVALVSGCGSSSKPHGDPDPGGKRLAELASVARVVVPPNASSIDLGLTKSTWGHGGCDGGPPGWTNMEAVQKFRATGNVVAEIDASMRRLRWTTVFPAEFMLPLPSGPNPAPAADGPTAPYVRQYEASSAPSAPVAWLFSPTETGGPYWEVDLEVAPAEVPDHAC